MRRVLGLLFGIGALLAVQSMLGADMTDQLLSTMNPTHSEANLRIVKASPEVTSLNLQAPAVTLEGKDVNFHSYALFSIAGEGSTLEDGNPSVPQVARFYRIPNTGGADLIVSNTDYELIENVDPYPYMDKGAQFGQVLRNEAVYSKDAWYPPQIAVMSDPMMMRDFRVVQVTLYPVQVNPVTHQARVYHNLSADIVANNQPSVNEIPVPHAPSGAFVPMYRSMISNLDEVDLANATTSPGSILILTSNNSTPKQFADSLALWKTRKGYKVTVDARASWTQSMAITAIQSDYAAWSTTSTPLEFVVLMGDPGASGGWGIPAGSPDYDHAYGKANNGDEIEDIGVGRLSGGDATTLATINAKLMAYERTPHMTTSGGAADTMWFRKAFLYAGIAQSCAGNYLIMKWGQRQFQEWTDVDSVTVLSHPTDAVDNQTIYNQINGGVGYFLWRGSWIGGMPTNIADGTTPAGRFPITMTITCTAGEYVSSGVNSPAEDWLCAGTPTNPKGGVCGMGTSTAGTQNGANGILAAGMVYNITDVQAEHLGSATAASKAELYRAYGPTYPDPESPGYSMALHFTEYFNLLGDPSMSMWLGVPKLMNVTCPTTLSVGARGMQVTVLNTSDSSPLEGALVCAWKKAPDSTWVRGLTNAQGQITLPISVNTAGTLMLTITKRGYKPFLFDIPCSSADQMPMVSSYTLDDDNAGGTSGNSNGLLNPGETIDIAVRIKNFGASTTATAVSAVMACDNPHITVVNANTSYPNIAAGDSAFGISSFRIHAAPDMQNGETALLTLTITSSAGTSMGVISLTNQTAGFVWMRQTISPTLNPGVTANLHLVVKNTGATALSNITGHLVSLSPFAQVNNMDQAFADAPVNSLDSALSDYSVSASSMATRGQQVPLRLVLTTPEGFSDSIQFNVSLGTATSTDPTGPDAYGYYAYDNTDTSYEMHPSYGYADISASGGTNLNINDTGEKTSPTPVWAAHRTLPFGFKFYGKVYNDITVCSNGWMAFGDWTTSGYDIFRNYQIPSMLGPDAFVAPYWDDLATTGTGRGVWVKSDSANHRYIVQWKANAWNGSSYSTALDFEVMLYDTSNAPTFSGNGKVLVQYNVVTMNLNNQYGDEPNGSTIGIQAPQNLIGLQYVYQNTYSPGAATVQSGRAILFTTDSRVMFGAMQGQVTDAATSLPMRNATVTISGYGYHTSTDTSGRYFLNNILIGTYQVSASAHRYNTSTIAGIVVTLHDTTTQDFSLNHPEMSLSQDSLVVSVQGQPVQEQLTISNAGNGPLDYNITIHYGGSGSINQWDRVDSINVSALTGSNQVHGCEFAGDYWYVATGGAGTGPDLIYRFDLHGNLTGSIQQPTQSVSGWFDMAWDGHLLWGSDSHNLVGIDTAGNVQATIPSPLNPCRAIAFNPATRHFFVGDYTQPIYEIDSTGQVLRTYANPEDSSLFITGLAWDSTDVRGYKLYVFSQNGASSLTRVTRLNPASGQMEYVTTLPGRPGEVAEGCTITSAWNSMLKVFACVIHGSAGDRLGMYEMDFNTSWIQIQPMSAVVPGGSASNIQIDLLSDRLRPNIYRVNLVITSSLLDSTRILPVALTVIDLGVTNQANHVLPTRYALHQNFPNPFNPTTTIRYELKSAGFTRLTVYNVMGEKVRDLVNERQVAGYYNVPFTGVDLPSGVYFYRIESGSFVQTSKMVLLK